ncbi:MULTISPECIES: alpha-2,8-polysialyltransferase family protein [Caballeronia]|uniref:alpha-2,8-polysialyltransferase family protein n=1 Tax=Caballeronia TaxID=1827195 RepID=UPI001EF55A35|nr:MULTISPECIES: alpha-2,8-polysialyltransferase family protein [Caballeronia]MCG7402263.1 alpha-2,8-polysialyltransferase family protein [Caballeronia zhejiangensis]MCI1047137.1 hypothetical protein [Caballeronia zhejiangensis]
MKNVIDALMMRLLPWRRIGRDLQGLEARLLKRFDASEQTVASELDRQRGQIDALITRQDRSFEKAGQQILDAVALLRPKRLFISTGYFATAMAAAIAHQQSRKFDDYLLVTIDRQSGADNSQWAYQVSDDWTDVQTIVHEQYYERASGSAALPFADIEFDEVYSPFVEMAEFVEKEFSARRYHFYEEGLTSYLQALRFAPPRQDSRFFALAPTAMRRASVSTSPIDNAAFRRAMQRASQCYRIPRFAGQRNIVIVTTGATPADSPDPVAMLDQYNELTASLLAKGYSVWVKGHPRMPLGEAFPQSKLAQMGARLLETDAPLLETVIACNPRSITAIVSVYSSILAHAFALFGIPAFSVRGGTVSEGQVWWKAVQDAIVPDAAELSNAEPDDIERVAHDFHNRNLAWEPPV